MRRITKVTKCRLLFGGLCRGYIRSMDICDIDILLNINIRIGVIKNTVRNPVPGTEQKHTMRTSVEVRGSAVDESTILLTKINTAATHLDCQHLRP